MTIEEQKIKITDFITDITKDGQSKGVTSIAKMKSKISEIISFFNLLKIDNAQRDLYIADLKKSFDAIESNYEDVYHKQKMLVLSVLRAYENVINPKPIA